MKNKHLKTEEYLFDWEFVFPEETPLDVCKDLFRTFMASLMVRDPNMAGVIVNYPLAISGRIFNTVRFEEGEIVCTSYVQSIRRVRMSFFDRLALWAWWPNWTRVKYSVTTVNGNVYTLWLRDASLITLDVLEACVYDEIDSLNLVLASQ